MQSKPLSEISKSISSGLTPLRSNPEFWDNGTIPWLKTEQLGEKYIYETNEHISNAALEKTSIKIVPENSLSIAMYGEGKTRGNVSILKKPMATNQACCNVIIDPDKADVEYVYYFLRTQYEELRNLSSGVRKNLNSNDIKTYPIRLPDNINSQKRISRVLKAFDDKIELNNRINAELEAMAKTLYDYWFVQFDFPDDSPQGQGKPYKTSGGKMVYNPTLKREIPEGWEPVSVGKIVDIKTGKEDANYATERGKYHFFTCGESALRCDDFVFEGKAVLLAGNGSFSVKRYEGKFNAYQRTYVLIPKQDELYAPLYFAVNDKVKTLTSGSRGSIVKFITKGDIEDIYLPLPTNRKLEFVKTLNVCFKESSRLYEQNLELVSLRDWLLPMLMNGQVTVGEAS